MTLRPRRPAASEIERLLGEAKAAAPTYPESRTVDPLARLGSPLARLIQRRVTNRYLEVVAEASGRG